MLFSFIDLKSHLKTRTRLFLLGVSIFGLLQFGSLFSEYKAYQADHDAVIGQSNKVIEGRVSDYQENNRGYKTFVVNGIQIETGDSFSKDILNGDSVKIEYYPNDNWNKNELKKLERRKK